MFGKLVEHASTALGRTFLVSGLVPGLVVLAVAAYAQWGTGAAYSVARLLKADQDALAIFSLALIVLVASALFFLFRGKIVRFHEELPLLPWRERLVQHALAKRHALDRERERLETIYTGAVWLLEGSGGEAYVPDDLPVPSDDEFVEQSRSGRSWLERFAADGHHPSSLTANEQRQLARGILALFVYGAKHPDAAAFEPERQAWVAASRAERARRALQLLQDAVNRQLARLHVRLQGMPVPLWVRPTEFGNRLSAIDDYAQRRYAIDTGVLWDRVWWVLDRDSREEIGGTRLRVEALLNLSVALWIAAAAALLCLLTSAEAASAARAGATAVLSALLAWGCYRLAVVAVEELGAKITPLIDVYRLVLLGKLGFRAETRQAELDLFGKLGQFFVQATPLDPALAIVMDTGEKKPPATEPPPPETPSQVV